MEQKKVGIWIRVSTLDQARGDSPEIHEHRARAYAESKGWEIVTIYHLEGISGKAIIQQEEAQRMIADIQSGKINALIFSKLARLGRNARELLEFADMFESYGASMISLQESIDTSSPAGRLMYTIISALAQLEREETIDRIMASNKTRRSLGKMAGGMASYGFDIVDAKLVINEKEAPIRKLMFELFLEHKRHQSVAKELTKRGYLTRKGKAFGGVAIKRLLTNTDAKGIHRSNYKGVQTKQNPLGYKPKEEWVFNPCPRIVSDELWDEVNAIIEYQTSNNKNARPLNHRVNLFTGYLYCHEGHKMTIQSKVTKYSCKQCKIRIERDDLEDIFKSRLKAFVNSKEERQDYQKSADMILYDKKQEIQSTKKTQKEVEEKMKQLLDLHLNKQIPTEGFQHHYKPLFDQSKQLINTITQLEKDLQHLTFTASNFNTLIKHSKGLYDSWDTLAHQEKRGIIESMTKKIIFDGHEIIFNLKQLPPLDSQQIHTMGISAQSLELPMTALYEGLKTLSTKLTPNDLRSSAIVSMSFFRLLLLLFHWSLTRI